ncbi:hypothetical protein Efla_002422 [Eimeria flavescens]
MWPCSAFAASVSRGVSRARGRRRRLTTGFPQPPSEWLVMSRWCPSQRCARDAASLGSAPGSARVKLGLRHLESAPKLYTQAGAAGLRCMNSRMAHACRFPGPSAHSPARSRLLPRCRDRLGAETQREETVIFWRTNSEQSSEVCFEIIELPGCSYASYSCLSRAAHPSEQREEHLQAGPKTYDVHIHPLARLPRLSADPPLELNPLHWEQFSIDFEAEASRWRALPSNRCVELLLARCDKSVAVFHRQARAHMRGGRYSLSDYERLRDFMLISGRDKYQPHTYLQELVSMQVDRFTAEALGKHVNDLQTY